MCSVYKERNLPDLLRDASWMCVQQFGNNNSVRHREKKNTSDFICASVASSSEEELSDAVRKSFRFMSYFEISKHLEKFGKSFYAGFDSLASLFHVANTVVNLTV